MIKGRPRTTIVDFFRKVDKQDSGCWLWLGAKTHNGYGRFAHGNKTRRAHRWIYEQMVGHIPFGLTIDHLCNVRACVNPEHMRVTTIGENAMRGEMNLARINRSKTHCPYGHVFAGHNLFMEGTRRRCRACNNARKARYYHVRGKMLREARRSLVADGNTPH